MPGSYNTAAVDAFVETIAPEAHPRSVFVVSTHVHVGPPLALALGAKWASRYPHNWLVPGALNGLQAADCAAEAGRCARLTELAARNRDDNLADIARWRPDILVVDNHAGYMTDPDFSWYEFLGADTQWDRILTDYRLSHATPRFDIWTRCDSAEARPETACPAPEPARPMPVAAGM